MSIEIPHQETVMFKKIAIFIVIVLVTYPYYIKPVLITLAANHRYNTEVNVWGMDEHISQQRRQQSLRYARTGIHPNDQLKSWAYNR